MIPDVIEPTVFDISWYYFIGRVKLRLKDKEVGRLTLRMFNKLYQHYKDNFDMEMQMKRVGITYAEAYKKAQEAESWF